MKNERSPTLFFQLKVSLLLILSILVCSAATIGANGILHPDNASSLGLAPRHLVSGELIRVFTSVFLTHDFRHLAVAILMVFLAVGWCELTLGPKTALWTFCLSHVTSVLIFTVSIGVLHWMRVGQTISTLYALHDVGPSAGYYGCLMRTILSVQMQRRKAWALSLFAILSARAAVSLLQMPDSQIGLSSDFVHLIAVSVGVILHRTSTQKPMAA